MPVYRFTALVGAMTFFVGCGSSPSASSNASSAAATAADTTGATIAAPNAVSLTGSKIAQQSTSSAQAQADQSETATSGSDDGSGTSKMANIRHGGVLGVRPSAGAVLGNGPISADFNVTLDFNAYLGPNSATANGAMSVDVHHGMGGDCNVYLTGSITETFSGGREIHQSTDPNIHVAKMGTRAVGRVVREIDGIVRRTLANAQDANEDFDLLIDHTGTTVTDLYLDSTLSSRSITGTIMVTDETTQATATVAFNDVTRPNPETCLCPTSGSITVTLVTAATTETSTHAFTATCGQVQVTVTGSAKTTSSTASSPTSAAADVDQTVTWGYCTPS